MASPRIITIDPMNVSADQKVYLSELLKVCDVFKLEVEKKYSLTIDGHHVLVQLTHPILHEVKTGVDQVKRSRYRILPKKNDAILGNGSFGYVCKVLGTLYYRPDSDLRLKINKPKVVKISNLFLNHDPAGERLAVASHEARISTYLPHLHAKPPVIVDDAFHMVMREFPGVELFRLIDQLYDDAAFISTDQCLQISINIMKALKKIHQLGVVHYDIKPENIIVDHVSGDVSIIDFGYAEHVNCLPMYSFIGTKCYSAPELYDINNATTNAADIYSLGLSLCLLWGGYFDEENADNIVARRVKGDESCTLDLNLLGKWALDDVHADLILTTLKDMINLDPTKRSLEYSIEIFEQIRIERKAQCLGDELLEEVLSTANRLANQTDDILPIMVDSDMDNFLYYLEEDLLMGIRALSSHPLALAEFKATLNINLFKNVESKADLSELVTTTIAEFKDRYTDIQRVLQQPDLNNHQKESLQLILNKYSRPYLTLDDIASITQKAQILLNELEPVPRLVLN